jgi:hypothetical protein
MIAHLIERKAAHDRFGRLGVYILAAKSRSDPHLFGRTADYIAIDETGGDRVRDPRITNCTSDTLGDAIKEIEWTQAQNTRSKADKTLHLVVSFQSHERPRLEVLRDIEDKLCESIGMADHQRISAIHEDTDNLHLHIAISRVHPTTFRNVDPHQSKRRLMQRCVELEVKHDLARDNHGVTLDVEPDHDPGEPQRGGGADQKMEAYAGRQSLKSWVAEHAAEGLGEVGRTAATWDELHKGLAAFGLNIVPHGAGFVVKAEGRRAAVKASDASPDLSFRKLTKRLGPYRAPGADIGDTEQTNAYEAAPVQEPSISATLYKIYEAERAATIERRSQSFDNNAKAHDDYIENLKAYHKTRRDTLAENWTVRGKAKVYEYEKLAEERRTDWAGQKELRKAQKAKILADNPLPTWQAWLQGRAEDGDTQALEVLRRREWGKRKFESEVLEAKDVESVKTVILARHKPKVRSNGDVHYTLQDGGLVIDRAATVHAKDITMAAAALSLILARDRFVGEITVNGSERYEQTILDAAVTYGFDITFKDAELEAKRQAGVAAGRVPEPLPDPPSLDTPTLGVQQRPTRTLRTPRPSQSPDRGEEGALAYVEARNDLRQRRPEIQDIPEHRVWTPADAGQVNYIRNVRFADHDTQGVILQRGDEYLVKPVTVAQAARAGENFRRGDAITLDPRGRFIQAPDRRNGRGGQKDQGLDR